MLTASESFQFSYSDFSDLLDQPFIGFCCAVRGALLAFFRVLDGLVFHYRLEVVTLFPAAITFLANAPMLPCDHMCALKESACFPPTRFAVRAGGPPLRPCFLQRWGAEDLCSAGLPSYLRRFPLQYKTWLGIRRIHRSQAG